MGPADQLGALVTDYHLAGRPDFQRVDSMRTLPGANQQQLSAFDRMAEARDDFGQSPFRALVKGALATPYEGVKGLAQHGGVAGAPARFLLNRVGPAIGAPELAMDHTTSPASVINPLSYWSGIGMALQERFR